MLRNIAFHRTLLIFSLFLLWELIAVLGYLDPDFISPPSMIVVALTGMMTEEDILSSMGYTAMEILTAFVITVLIGVIGGFIFGLSQKLWRVSEPIVMLLFGLPKIALLPLFILIFGIGFKSTVFFATTYGLFPILLNVITGTQTVDRALLNAATSMGASRMQIFTKIIMPSSLPSIVTGMRLGMSQTVLGVLLAELFATTAGIGFFVQLYTSSFRPEMLFALFFLVAAVAISINETLRYLERKASVWKEEFQNG